MNKYISDLIKLGETTNKMSGKNIAEMSGKKLIKMSGKTTNKLRKRNYGKGTANQILNLIQNNPSIKMQQIASQLGITDDGVYYHIRNLTKKNIIKRIGGRKQGYWEIIEND